MNRLIILTLATLTAATPAAAARDGREPFRTTVSTAGLDLASAEGKAALLARVAKEADRICGPQGNPAFDGGERSRLCRTRFLEAARVRVSLAE